MKRFFTFLAALLLTAASVSAQTAYAIWCEGNTTLYFDYTSTVMKAGDTYSGNVITSVYSCEYDGNVTPWRDNVNPTRVVIQDSMRNYHPEKTAYWFANCTKLTEIAGLKNLQTDQAVNMNDMFSNCKQLTSLDLSGFNTSNAKYMSSMFQECNSLTSLDLSSFDTSNVTHISYMFFNCAKLESVNLSSFNTSNVIILRGLFMGCKSLKSVDLSNFDTSNVTDMKQMFHTCWELTEIDLRNFNTSKVTAMDEMFEYCINLTTIYCNDTWTAETSGNMFLGSTKLVGAVSYDASKTDVSMANPTTGYFTAKPNDPTACAIWCENNQTLYFDYIPMPSAGTSYQGQSVTKAWDISNLYAGNSNDIPWDDICPNILHAVLLENISDFLPYATAYWFSGCYNMEDITGLDYLNTSQVSDMRNMFYGCHKLTDIDIAKWNTSNVKSMSAMFFSCENVTSLDISNWNTDKLTSAANLFENCKSLTELKLGDFNTSQLITINGMFAGCESLTTIDLSSFNTSNVYGFGRLFENCKSLAEIDLSRFDMSSATLVNSMLPDVKASLRSTCPTLYS